MVTIKEEWKDIPEYEGIYQVSNLGRVKRIAHVEVTKYGVSRNLKEKFLVQTPDHKGYLMVNLYKHNKGRTRRVHRLVAEAFVENPFNYPQVNHKDENRKNNKFNNLEWCTNKYNANYGTRPERVGIKSREMWRKKERNNK